jgi:hypothetical protein
LQLILRKKGKKNMEILFFKKIKKLIERRRKTKTKKWGNT